MKLLGITLAAVLVGSLLFWITWGDEPSSAPADAPTPAEEQEVEEEPVALLEPPELEDLEDGEIVSEEEVDTRKFDIEPGELTKPRILGRRTLPDGRVEARILSPIYYGDGEKKVVIRVLRASPRRIKRDALQVRVPDRRGGQAPAAGDAGDGAGAPAGGGGELEKKENK